MDNPTCGYCGGEAGPEAATRTETFAGPDGATYLGVDLRDRSSFGRPSRTVTVALCSACAVLRGFADRSVWAAILGADRVARFSDGELREAGRGIIVPVFRLGGYASRTSAEPWSHVNRGELRAALAVIELPELLHPAAAGHRSGRGCGSCSVATSADWEAQLGPNGWPICGDCGSGAIRGELSAGRRLRMLFPEISGGIVPIDPSTFRAFMETDAADERPEGFPNRFGYVSAADRQALARHITNLAWNQVPADWVRRYRRTPARPATLKRGAVGV